MHPADFYSGIVVDAYALLKASRFDTAPYVDFVRAEGEPALEIGCGDGEPFLDLCAAGLDVDGVDSSSDMVLRCRTNAESRGVATRVFHQRVEDVDLGRRYAAIYFAGPIFTLLADDPTPVRALRAIRTHLTDDGAALVPLWVPDPTPEGELGVTRAADGGEGVELRYTPWAETYDSTARTRTTRARYERVSTDGTEVADREWVIHWHTPTSFRAMAEAAGLTVARIVDADGGPVSEDCTDFTVVVRRVPVGPSR